MPNLDTLHIRLLDLARINLKWVPDFLATALHPEINAKAFGPTTIIFDVWLHNIHQLKDSLWNDIAGALSHLITCGKRLHCIEFVQRGPLEVPLVEFIVREALAGPEFLVSKLAFSRGITE